MATTNGFNDTRVYDTLKVRRGWAQPTYTAAPTLDSNVTTCNSGKYFEDVHAACAIKVLHAIQEDPDLSDSGFISYLVKLRRGVIMDMVSKVLPIEVVDKPQMVFKRIPGLELKLIPNQGKFVGYEIRVAEGEYAAQLHGFSLLLNGAVTFNLYLYNDMKKDPLVTQSVTTVADDLKVVTLDDKILSYLTDTTKGGTYYFGYKQNDLGSVQAYDIQSEYRTFKAIDVNPVELGISGGIPVYTDYSRFASRNYGLNLEISSYKDHTQTVIDRAADFDNLLGLMMAAKCIDEAHNSLRSNGTERLVKEQVLMWYDELNRVVVNDQRPYGKGIKTQIEKEIKTVRETFRPTPEPMSVSL